MYVVSVSGLCTYHVIGTSRTSDQTPTHGAVYTDAFVIPCLKTNHFTCVIYHLMLTDQYYTC